METFQKFFFLGVMMAVTVFAYHGSPASETQNSPRISFDPRPFQVLRAAAPVIVLSAPLPKIITDAPRELATSSASTAMIDSQAAVRKVFAEELPRALEAELFGEEKKPEPATQYDVPLFPSSNVSNILVESSGVSNRSFYRVKDGMPPDVMAEKALVSDLKSGEDFFMVRPHERWPLASLTKLMGAVVLLKDFNLDTQITIGATDFLPASQENSLSIGDRYRARDLVRAMLSASSNEAAEALANSYGRANFIAAMNNQARDWNLNDTHFDDPTGLSASNQSTASDLKKLTAHIYNEYPEVFKITRQRTWSIREIDSGKTKLVKSINLFAGEADFLGGKTGYTDEAGGNLISLFKYRERPVLVIVLGSNDRFGETEQLLSWFKNNFSSSR